MEIRLHSLESPPQVGVEQAELSRDSKVLPMLARTVARSFMRIKSDDSGFPDFMVTDAVSQVGTVPKSYPGVCVYAPRGVE